MNITLTRDEITHLAEFHSNNGHTAQAEYFMGLLEAPTSAVQCVEVPQVLRDACIEWMKHADHKDGLDNVESALYGAIVLCCHERNGE